MELDPINLGYSVAAIFGDCGRRFLDEPEKLSESLLAACDAAGYKVVTIASHAFIGQGMTCVLILSQSHIVCHTWPEHRLLAIDLFACAPMSTLDVALEVIRDKSGSRWVSKEYQAREHSVSRQRARIVPARGPSVEMN